MKSQVLMSDGSVAQGVVNIDRSGGLVGIDAPALSKEVAGHASATITTNTTAVAGNFIAVTVLADAVFESLTRANTSGSLGATIVPAGVTIFGTITGYQLTSGAVIAYGA